MIAKFSVGALSSLYEDEMLEFWRGKTEFFCSCQRFKVSNSEYDRRDNEFISNAHPLLVTCFK
jgi:hypothetical protein